jgi:hypothetical protein
LENFFVNYPFVSEVYDDVFYYENINFTDYYYNFLAKVFGVFDTKKPSNNDYFFFKAVLSFLFFSISFNDDVELLPVFEEVFDWQPFLNFNFLSSIIKFFNHLLPLRFTSPLDFLAVLHIILLHYLNFMFFLCIIMVPLVFFYCFLLISSCYYTRYNLFSTRVVKTQITNFLKFKDYLYFKKFLKFKYK